MKRLLISITCLLSLATAAWADRLAINTTVIHAAEHGRVYVRSVPDDQVGHDGVTRVYRVGDNGGEDILLEEYGWYSKTLRIGGTVLNPIIVRFGHRPNGRGPSAEALAIGFYRGGEVVREYSTLEIHGCGSGLTQSVSSHWVFRGHGAFHRLGDGRSVYRIPGVSGKEFMFDPATGDVLDPIDG